MLLLQYHYCITILAYSMKLYRQMPYVIIYYRLLPYMIKCNHVSCIIIGCPILSYTVICDDNWSYILMHCHLLSYGITIVSLYVVFTILSWYQYCICYHYKLSYITTLYYCDHIIMIWTFSCHHAWPVFVNPQKMFSFAAWLGMIIFHYHHFYLIIIINHPNIVSSNIRNNITMILPWYDHSIFSCH